MKCYINCGYLSLLTLSISLSSALCTRIDQLQFAAFSPRVGNLIIFKNSLESDIRISAATRNVQLVTYSHSFGCAVLCVPDCSAVYYVHVHRITATKRNIQHEDTLALLRPHAAGFVCAYVRV